MEKEAVLTRDNHNLQGTMVSQYKPGQLIDASWKFTIDGQYAFCLNRYNQKNKKWEVINYNDTGILEQWENNAELAQDLATLSMGDSDLCLKEILKQQKEMPSHHTLQGTMVSQYKPGQLIHASWNFTIDEKYSFCFIRYNKNNKIWEVINYNATGILEKWEKNAELAQDLAVLSMGDSRHCLEEYLKHQKEMPNAASLCYSLTVGKSGSGPWWHKVQGQLNKETFLCYISINNCHVFGVLENRLNATKLCDKQVDTLKDGVDQIKQQVIHMKQEPRRTDPGFLQPLKRCISLL
ncbi:NKG2D ligand 4 [Cricetulus griseus]|uniref:NKG2D ligand 4 n=1 Tax=Cricetulus griseus TaxID=10029 RepID=G3H3S2_CRIGR|nr:NKG2D ligand 4 [Cricetulus griseus]